MSKQPSGRRKPLSNRTLYEPDAPGRKAAAPSSFSSSSASTATSRAVAEPSAASSAAASTSFSSSSSIKTTTAAAATTGASNSSTAAAARFAPSDTQEPPFGRKCFRCGQRGHARAECPFRRDKGKQKGKAVQVKGQQQQQQQQRAKQGRRGEQRGRNAGGRAQQQQQQQQQGQQLVAGMPISLLKKEVAKNDAGLKHLVVEDQQPRILAQDAPHPGLGKLRKLWFPGAGFGSASASVGAAAAANSHSVDQRRRGREDGARNSGVASTFAFPLVSRNWRLVTSCGTAPGSVAAGSAASGASLASSMSAGAAATVAAAAGAQSLRKDPAAFTVVGVLGRQGVGKSYVLNSMWHRLVRTAAADAAVQATVGNEASEAPKISSIAKVVATQLPFREQSKEDLLHCRCSTRGVLFAPCPPDLPHRASSLTGTLGKDRPSAEVSIPRVTSPRVILVDSQPVLSAYLASAAESGAASSTALPEDSAEIRAVQQILFLFQTCDTVLVVEDGANGSDFDFSLWNLIRSAAVLLGNEAISAQASTATPSKPAPKPQKTSAEIATTHFRGNGRLCNLIVVQNQYDWQNHELHQLYSAEVSSLAQEFLKGTIFDPKSVKTTSSLQTHSLIAPGTMPAASGTAKAPVPVLTEEQNVHALIFPHIPKLMNPAGGKTGEVAYAKELLHEVCFELSQRATYGAGQTRATVHRASRPKAPADCAVSEAAWLKFANQAFVRVSERGGAFWSRVEDYTNALKEVRSRKEAFTAMDWDSL